MIYQNIFVLSPGRSGSKTFAKACSHLSNYTSAHESLAAKIGDQRFAYPAAHIEADNRLTWFLGDLAERFSGEDILYVHLTRNLEDTVSSFHHRLKSSSYRASIMNAFAHGIVMKPGDWQATEERELALFYVETVHKNISFFLKNRRQLHVDLEDGGVTFARFLSEIEAEGDLEAAKRTWLEVHNAR